MDEQSLKNSYVSEISQLTNTKEKLLNDINDLNIKISVLRFEELTKLESTIRQSEDKKTELQNQINLLNTQHRDISEAFNKLNTTYATKKTEYDTICANAENKLKYANIELNKAITKKKEEFKAYQKEVETETASNLEHSKEVLQKANEEAKIILGDATSQAKLILDKADSDANERIETAKKSAKQLADEGAKAYSDKIKQSLNELNQKNNELALIQKTIDETMIKKGDILEELVSIEHLLTERQSKLKNLNELIIYKQSKHEISDAELYAYSDKQVEQLSKQVEDLNLQINLLQQDLNTANEKLEETLNQNRILDNNFTEVTNQRNQLTEIKNALELQLNEKTNQLTELNNKLANQQSELETLKSEKVELENNLTKLKNDLHTKLSQPSTIDEIKIDEPVLNLDTETIELQATIESLEFQLDEINKKCNALQSNETKYKSAINDLNKQIEKYKQINDELKSSDTQTKERLSLITTKYQELMTKTTLPDEDSNYSLNASKYKELFDKYSELQTSMRYAGESYTEHQMLTTQLSTHSKYLAIATILFVVMGTVTAYYYATHGELNFVMILLGLMQTVWLGVSLYCMNKLLNINKEIKMLPLDTQLFPLEFNERTDTND